MSKAHKQSNNKDHAPTPPTSQRTTPSAQADAVATDDVYAKLTADLKKLDKMLWFALPIFGLLLSFLFANLTWFSTLFTPIIFIGALVAVGIKKYSLTLTIIFCVMYCFIDNYISYNYQFSVTGLKRQALTMVLFISAVGLARPMIERALFKKHSLNL
ncbi:MULTISPECIES: hypothetical protein [unclassified Acinetobacter]|uniref:hypothetical protein n=1 Tax=unclassified Acinetobacter TaxID=196816 RepID=UPI0035B93624